MSKIPTSTYFGLPLQRVVRASARYFGEQCRDSRYVIVAILSLMVLAFTTAQAFSQGLFDSVERPIFHAVNNLPSYIGPVMFLLTQFGGFGAILIWCGAAWYLINRRGAFTVLGAGFTAWLAAKVFKDWVGRGRPSALLHAVHLFGGEHFSGYGFPSGHATFSAACATVLYFQVSRKYRKYLVLLVFLVGLSRMYLGAHFPLDVIGGWSLGALIGSAICLIFGVSTRGISARRLKSILQKKGYDIQNLQFADVDARGSRPLFMRDANGTEYFGKIFGAQEHASDWLFKIYRFFRYKNLQGEEPYLNGRRNIELETFATMWARQGGVRVPQICDLVRLGQSWLLIQEKIPAKPLSEAARIQSKTLVDAWRQVRKMHAANMAHRDLRAANVMVGTQGQAWIIDFGFAEVAPRAQRQRMDIAELLMSMALVAGVRRTLDAAFEVLEPTFLEAALPYLQKEVFSGATAKQLRTNKDLLTDMKNAIKKRLGITEEIADANIVRFNRRKIINIALLGLFVYIIVPQFSLFKGSLRHLPALNPAWLPVVVAASILTYVCTAAIYVALAEVPLRFWTATLVQLAASFMSKVVPGGLGGTSLNARYLKKAGMDGAETAALLAAQGVIGVVMFVIPLTLFMLLNGRSIHELLTFHMTTREIYALAGAAAVGALAIGLFGGVRRKAVNFVGHFVASVRDFATSPDELAWAAAASFAVTLCYIGCLYACMQAFGLHPGLSEVILIYVSAMIAKAVIPAPGGLGPLELAMLSSMVGFGLAQAEAIAVVVLYRLATFWLPIPLSVLAYRRLEKQRVI